jgi:NADP-dependent alcohol dehydrogenase
MVVEVSLKTEFTNKNLKGHEIVEFSGIEPNPHFETLKQLLLLKNKILISFLQ